MKTELEKSIKKIRNQLKKAVEEQEKVLLRKELDKLKLLQKSEKVVSS